MVMYMEKMRLGRSGLMVGRSGFGALPLQRISHDASIKLLRKAVDGGIDFIDTARFYTDSEEKIGAAVSPVRQQVTIATKAMGKTRREVLESFTVSLHNLKTDYVDLLQLHNPSELPDVNDPDSACGALLEARKNGMARFIGITCHRLENARAAVNSGFYDTVQFPLNPLSSVDDMSLVNLCKTHDVGLIAMKALSGGLISNAAASFAFLRQFDNVLPIWGIQLERELDEFLAMEAQPPKLDQALREAIKVDRRELAGLFCRGCGYCMPCPAGIEISWVARMKLLLRRAPSQGFLGDEWKEKMARIKTCTLCGACRKKCPYHLDVPALLKINLDDYETFYRQTKSESS